MRNAGIASTALMATSALAQGTAHVVNACPYDVYLANTPAQGGGYDIIDETLSTGDSYSQPYTELSNGMGWSIKMAKTPSYQTNLLQYEYTYHNDGTIWYDLSQVDGNPWDGDWMITASSGCAPKQQAYRYATDDAYGMQSCKDGADITVTLCSGDDNQIGGDGSSEPASSPAEYSVAPASTTSVQSSTTESESQPTTTEAAPSTTTTESESEPTTTQQGSWHHHGGFTFNNDDFAVKAAEVTPSPTTLVTKQVSTTDAGDYDATVTNYVTEIATAYVTAGAKRHAHHPRHFPQGEREE